MKFCECGKLLVLVSGANGEIMLKCNLCSKTIAGDDNDTIISSYVVGQKGRSKIVRDAKTDLTIAKKRIDCPKCKKDIASILRSDIFAEFYLCDACGHVFN